MKWSNGLVACLGMISGCIVVPPPNSTRVSPAPEVIDTTYVTPVAPEYQPPAVVVAPVYQDDLQPYGRWLDHPKYGRCWSPSYVSYGWRPYTVGHWAYTDDGNCMWVSEDRESQWGGIVYHYGQWAQSSDVGWIWVPGTTWAPAWVAWREGGGYCGWAPLPPEAVYQNQVTVIQADRYCPADQYVYVDERNLNVARVDRQITRNNITVINKTTNITNITVVNNTVINNGVPSRNVERVTGQPIRRVNVVQASNADQARQLSARGAAVHYASPAIERAHAAVSQRTQIKAAPVRMNSKAPDLLRTQPDKPMISELQAEKVRSPDSKTALAEREQLNAQRQAQRAAAAVDLARRNEAARQTAQTERSLHTQAAREATLTQQSQAAQQQRDALAARQAQRDQAAERARQAQSAEQKNQAGRQVGSKPTPGQVQTHPPVGP